MNYTTEIKGDKLVITVDISKSAIDKAPLSKTGKTKLVASTKGFTKVGSVGVSLNVTAQ